MAPHSTKNDEVPLTDEAKLEKLVAPQAGPRKYVLLYKFILMMSFWHLCGLYGLYLCLTSAKWATILFNILLHWAQVTGVTAGAHRLWAHRSYKAKLPLQITLMLFHTLACQYTITHWARDHRLHHKHSDTDADPHNAARGVFFSHIGWLLVKKHPEAVRKGKTIDVSDLYENPVLQFQAKYSLILIAVICFLLPTIIPMYCWGETAVTAFSVTVFRVAVGLNIAFTVNSLAHKFGNKPYDKHMSPTQSVSLSIATLGECFHNYHHAFPFDYRTAELGNNYINLTTKFIDFCAWAGWVYDRKTATDDMIVNRMKRTGDGTDLWGRSIKDFQGEGGSSEDSYHYGWGDAETSEENKDKLS